MILSMAVSAFGSLSPAPGQDEQFLTGASVQTNGNEFDDAEFL
jgi:hypothetical protein